MQVRERFRRGSDKGRGLTKTQLGRQFTRPAAGNVIIYRKMKSTCFCDHADGDQPGAANAVGLRARYTDLIKEAFSVEPNLDMVRADDIEKPGGITSTC